MMCEAAHFMTIIPRDLEMVSDDGFLPVLYKASTNWVYLKSPGSEFTAVSLVKPH